MTIHDDLFAVCSRQQAEQLIRYDHHYICINGRLGIMLTYHWMPLEAAAEPLVLKVVFHDSARQHPPVPPEIQALVDHLVFEEKLGMLTDPDADLELRPEVAESLRHYLTSERRGEDADEVFRSLGLT